MTDPPPPERQFTITVVFDAPRELVFKAWTDPEHVARWFGPRGVSAPPSTISMDVRPRGTWRLTMVDDDSGAEYPSVFVYREVVEPERLVFITSLLADRSNADERSVVTVTFTDLGGRTEMTFHAAGFTEREERAGVQDGWSSMFDRLAEHLATG